MDKVRARYSIIPERIELTFQSPWIRFAQHLLIKVAWGGADEFQSPWIRFARVNITHWRGGDGVSIPVDKVRAVVGVYPEDSLERVSIPVDKVRAVKTCLSSRKGVKCFNPRG